MSGLAERQLGWKIAEEFLAEALGEPVETILKGAWPNEAFPDLVGRWTEQYRPDVVVIQVNNFWYGYESIPLWLERRLGLVGRRLGQSGMMVGNTPWFADSRLGQVINRTMLRLLPGETHFTVPDVARCMELTIRRVLSHEGTALVVRGNDDWPAFPMATKSFNRRNALRNEQMSGAMQEMCRRLHVNYVQLPPVDPRELKLILNSARWHYNEHGERRSGELDGRAMLEAVKAT